MKINVPEKSLLGLLFCTFLGYFLTTHLWKWVSVPFHNTYEILSVVTNEKFNPLTNQVRYILFIFSPLIVWSLGLMLIRRRLRASEVKPAIGAEVSTQSSTPGYRIGRCYFILFLCILGFWVGSSFLRFFLHFSKTGLFFPFVSGLDFYHEGEFLAPALNYLATNGGIWSSSLFVHGAFYDPLTPILAQKLFGSLSIGGSRLISSMMHFLIPLSGGALIATVVLVLRKRSRDWFFPLMTGLILLLGWVITEHQFHIVDRRDIPVFLGLSFLILGYAYRLPWASFLSGLFAPICFFYTIDRGAYYFAAIFGSLGLYTLILRSERYWRVAIPACAFGAVLGFIGWGLAFGWGELAEFFKSTFYLFRVKDFLDGYPYPRPKVFHNLTSAYFLPMQFIGFQILVFADCIRRYFRHGIEREFFVVQAPFVLSSFFFFRNALGRVDEGHILYSSLFVFLGFSLVLAFALREIRSVRSRRYLLVVVSMLCFSVILVRFLGATQGSKWQISFAQMRNYVARPDSSFLGHEDNRVLARFQEVFRDEPCLFNFTGEIAWSYLLRKPTCTKYYVINLASPKKVQMQVIEYLKQKSPKRVLLEARNPNANALDGIRYTERLASVFRYLSDHYRIFENVDGYLVYERKGL